MHHSWTDDEVDYDDELSLSRVLPRARHPEDPNLREVSDPRTPPERLEEIWRAEPITSRDTRTTRMFIELRAQQMRLLARNPNLPLSALRELLNGRSLDNLATWIQVEAWRNPSLPLLMFSQPDEKYSEHALAALLCCEGLARVAHLNSSELRGYRYRLPSRVEFWAHAPPAGDIQIAYAFRWLPRNRGLLADIRAFAQHLAGLFSLPWPPPPEPLSIDLRRLRRVMEGSRRG